MPLVFSEDVHQCTPFDIGDGASESGSRLGGRSPEGVAPRDIADARYFATIILATHPTEEASIFFPMDGDVVAAPNGVLHEDMVEVIVHGESRRRETTQNATSISGHPLVLLPRKEDWFQDDDGQFIVEPHHKFGGRPYFIHNEPAIEDAVMRLMKSGFLQVVQFDFPAGGNDALIHGNWPFFDGMFHLFGRRSSERWEWRWFWDF